MAKRVPPLVIPMPPPEKERLRAQAGARRLPMATLARSVINQWLRDPVAFERCFQGVLSEESAAKSDAGTSRGSA